MSSLWVDFAAIKGSVDIEQVLEHYRVRLKRVRKDYLRGLCLEWTPFLRRPVNL